MEPYDQTQSQTPLPLRIVWFVLWLIVIGVVVWIFIWLIFLRQSGDTGDKLTTGSKSQPTQQSGAGHDTTSGSTGNASSTPKTSNSATSAAPQRLANAGAGNVLVPAAAAFGIGTSLAYIRIRRKLAA